MKKLISFFVALFMVAIFLCAADYATRIYRSQGGDEMVVASGGKVSVQSGGILDIESGGLFKLAGTAATLTTQANLKTQAIAQGMYTQDQASFSAAQKAVVVGNSGTVKGGSHTVTAGEVSGNSVVIATGLSSITAANIQTLRANVAQYSETITISAGNITIAGGGGYTLTENDVIKWIAVGGL